MNIYDIEKIVKEDPQAFYNEFMRLLNCKNYHGSIKYLKKSGVFLGTNKVLINTIEKILYQARSASPIISEFLEQYKLIKEINDSHKIKKKFLLIN